ncbi:MAG: precorrin-8X methylmutase [Spongiibacteraceae bacterium]
MEFHYEADPIKIEQQSFCQIRTLTPLEGFSTDEQQIVMRLVHTCGDPTAAEDVYFSDNAVKAGLEALVLGSQVLCDVEMVRHGVTKRMINTKPLCFLNDEDIPALAKAAGETRTMAALQKWLPYLENSIVMIGNAPTALFRLLEMLRDGAPKPKLIIGMPVGFVGAAESKEALKRCHRDLSVECVTILGRRGGSALTAATLNTLLRMRNGIMM